MVQSENNNININSIKVDFENSAAILIHKYLLTNVQLLDENRTDDYLYDLLKIFSEGLKRTEDLYDYWENQVENRGHDKASNDFKKTVKQIIEKRIIFYLAKHVDQIRKIRKRFESDLSYHNRGDNMKKLQEIKKAWNIYIDLDEEEKNKLFSKITKQLDQISNKAEKIFDIDLKANKSLNYIYTELTSLSNLITLFNQKISVVEYKAHIVQK